MSNINGVKEKIIGYTPRGTTAIYECIHCDKPAIIWTATSDNEFFAYCASHESMQPYDALILAERKRMRENKK